jgi:hypothetical protein
LVQLPTWMLGFLFYGECRSYYHQIRLTYGGLANFRETMLYLGREEIPWAVRYEFDLNTTAEVPGSIFSPPSVWMSVDAATKTRYGTHYSGKVQLTPLKYTREGNHVTLELGAEYWKKAFLSSAIGVIGTPAQRVAINERAFQRLAKQIDQITHVRNGGRLHACWIGQIRMTKEKADPPLEIDLGTALERQIAWHSRLHKNAPLVSELLLAGSVEKLARLGLTRCEPVPDADGLAPDLICYGTSAEKARGASIEATIRLSNP